MTVYEAWLNAQPDAGIADPQLRDRVAAARSAVARGQALFNSKPIQIRDVRGLNDALGIQTIPGTCTTCHNSPNVGNHSVPLPLDIGVTDASRRTPTCRSIRCATRRAAKSCKRLTLGER